MFVSVDPYILLQDMHYFLSVKQRKIQEQRSKLTFSKSWRPLTVKWLPSPDFHQNFGRQKFFPLAMVTKMFAAWSAEEKDPLWKRSTVLPVLSAE